MSKIKKVGGFQNTTIDKEYKQMKKIMNDNMSKS